MQYRADYRWIFSGRSAVHTKVQQRKIQGKLSNFGVGLGTTLEGTSSVLARYYCTTLENVNARRHFWFDRRVDA